MVDRIAAKFKGHQTEAFLNGVPARDIHEAEYATLSDEAKAAIKANAESPHAIYELRVGSQGEAKRVAKSDAVEMPAAPDVPSAKSK